MVLSLVFCVRPAVGQMISPSRLLGRYQQFVWQDQHGLPQNGISTVAQTADGYIWLATAEGVVRFDGVRFTAFDTGNTPELKSNNIAAVMADHTGALWACHGNGLNRYKDGRFTFFGTEQDLPDNRVGALFEDRAGDLWIGTEGGLYVYREGRFATYTTKDGLPDNRVMAFAEDAEGGLWIGTFGGLARFHNGRFTVYTTRDGLASNQISALCWDRAGTLWIGTDGSGVSRFNAGRFSSAGLPAGLQRNRVRTIAADHAGNVWIGSIGNGLFRFKDGRFDALTTRDGLANDFIQSVYPAPNGDVWLGTQGGGLVLLKDARFAVYTVQDGLPHEIITAIRADGEGALWVNSLGGLSRFKDGRFTVMTARDGLPDGRVRAFSADREGNLLVNTRVQVLRYREGRFSPYLTSAGSPLSNILADRAGNLWAGTQFDGLLCFREGQVTAYSTRDGLADNYITALFEDRAGALWVGTGNGLSRRSDGRFTTWTQKDGFPGKHMLSFYEDRAGQLWMGTDGNGLIRFSQGKFTAITTHAGLYDNLAFQILEDAGGNLWMSGNKGIYRAPLKELNEFADGRRKMVASFAYGAADGMLSRECNGASPAGWKTADGRLWFPTIKGLVAVNPQQRDTQPPLVAIEQVSLDGAALPAGQSLQGIQLWPGQENLEIQYTALSWNRPQQIRFKYQLLGADHDWVEAGTRRTAYYAHLKPGSYTFRVSADNGDGVWNETGASFKLVVVPPFYRTWWFLTLSLAGGVGLVLFGYKLRVRQLERARAVQEAFSHKLLVTQEEERRRMAIELHDGLGQNLLVIKNRAAIAKLTSRDLPAAFQQFDQIADSTMQAIQEVRQIAYNLRPHHLDNIGLTRSLEEMLRRVEESSGIGIACEIEALDGALPKEAEINFYRIVQEAVSNIVKHARATRAGVEIERREERLHLTIRDNGCGCTVEELAERRGLGLASIAERVRILGGSCRFESAPGKGTTVAVELPLPSQEPKP
jgi:ligand-binding sensor domain-containing protein/two-component sensor histidine kinase